MNERIQELRKQALQWVVDNHQPVDPKNLSQAEIDQRYLMYEEKFALLIVSESIKVMTQHDYHGEWLGEKLREHFGIK